MFWQAIDGGILELQNLLDWLNLAHLLSNVCIFISLKLLIRFIMHTSFSDKDVNHEHVKNLAHVYVIIFRLNSMHWG